MSETTLPEGWEGKTDGVEEVDYEAMADTPRDVAVRVAAFIEDCYGDQANSADVSEGLWLAMQMLAGPCGAASVLRYCGVNFVNK